MKKLLKIKNNIIVILCVTIVFLAIGFVVISVKMENMIYKKEVFDVSFTDFRQITSIKGGLAEPNSNLAISSNGKILSLNFELYTEHDEIDYEVTITNNGTIAAVIDELVMSPDFSDPIVLQAIDPIVVRMSDISGKLLEPGEETTIKLSVMYNTGIISGKKSVTGKIGIISETIK